MRLIWGLVGLYGDRITRSFLEAKLRGQENVAGK
jgi:hypothetical protein